MVVPTGVVVCGRADGPHRPIERLRLESLNRRIRDDPPYQACSVQSAPTPVGVETQRTPAVLRSVSAGSLSFAGRPMRAGGSI
jgi:hypothetical protein